MGSGKVRYKGRPAVSVKYIFCRRDVLTRQPNTTARYSHLFDDPLRQATERVGAVVTAAGNGETAEIVNLRDDGVA